MKTKRVYNKLLHHTGNQSNPCFWDRATFAYREICESWGGCAKFTWEDLAHNNGALTSIFLSRLIHPNWKQYLLQVPLGPMAFMPGKLVHTNELLVSLGSNYYVEQSAKQARGIIDRRVKSTPFSPSVFFYSSLHSSWGKLGWSARGAGFIAWQDGCSAGDSGVSQGERTFVSSP